MTIPPDYPWRPAMLWRVDGGECPVCRGAGGFRWHEADGSENGETCPCSGRVPDWMSGRWVPRGAVPDLTDGPTKGALLEAVREAYGDPRMYVWPWADRWAVSDGFDAARATASTEGAALLAAWEARPR